MIDKTFYGKKLKLSRLLDGTLNQSKKDALESLKALSKLEKNWDSYGGDAPTIQAMSEAACIICYADDDLPSPDVFRDSRGNVQLEYYGKGFELEINIESKDSAEINFKAEGENTEKAIKFLLDLIAKKAK